MGLDIIMEVVTFLVTLVLGFIAKKHPQINNKLIPLQNLLVGIIATLVYYLFTKDWNVVLAGIGLFAGGTYDFGKNMTKLLIGKEPKYDYSDNDNFDDMEG